MNQKKWKLSVIIAIFAWVLFAGMWKTQTVHAMANTIIYIEVGESYKQSISSKKPILSGYGDADEKVATASINSSGTTLTITGKSAGTATFYVNKNGNKDAAARVRLVKVHVIAKASNMNTNIKNSISHNVEDEDNYANQSVWIYTGNKVTCTLASSGTLPSDVSADTSGKAKAAKVYELFESTKEGGTVSQYLTGAEAVNGLKRTFTCNKSGTTYIKGRVVWYSSNGTAHITKARIITMYCISKPVISVFTGEEEITKMELQLNNPVELTYSIKNLRTADRIEELTVESVDENKFEVEEDEGYFTLVPKSLTNGTAVNLVITAALDNDIALRNGEEYVTIKRYIPVTVLSDHSIHVTGLTFTKSQMRVAQGKSKTQKAQIVPADATNQNVFYKSDDTSVAVVDANGKVTGIAVGTATITAVSAFDEEIEASYEMTVVLNAPKITAKSVKKGNRIQWKKISGAKSYLVYRKAGKGSYKKVATTKKRTFTDKKVIPGRTYTYKVSSVPQDSGYKSGYSNTANVKYKLKRPKLTSVKRHGQGYLLSIKGTRYKGYQLYYGTDKKCRTYLGTTSSKHPLVFVSLKKGKTYYFRIKSYTKVGKKTKFSKYSKVFTYKG